MYKLDNRFLDASKGLIYAHKLFLNKIESAINEENREDALKGVRNYKKFKKSLRYLKHHRKDFEDKLKRLESLVKELPKPIWNGNGKEKRPYDFSGDE